MKYCRNWWHLSKIHINFSNFQILAQNNLRPDCLDEADAYTKESPEGQNMLDQSNHSQNNLDQSHQQQEQKPNPNLSIDNKR